MICSLMDDHSGDPAGLGLAKGRSYRLDAWIQQSDAFAKSPLLNGYLLRAAVLRRELCHCTHSIRGTKHVIEILCKRMTGQFLVQQLTSAAEQAPIINQVFLL